MVWVKLASLPTLQVPQSTKHEMVYEEYLLRSKIKQHQETATQRCAQRAAQARSIIAKSSTAPQVVLMIVRENKACVLAIVPLVAEREV